MRNRAANSKASIEWCMTLLVIVLASACAPKEVPLLSTPTPQQRPAAPATTPAPSPKIEAPKSSVIIHAYRETGISSWYGKEFHGRKTASGETFDMYGMSAAHRTLPLGTVIRVTNLDNYKSIKVKVNDRGPFIANRILELSYGAARELAFAAQGTAPVKIENLDQPVQEAGIYSVLAAVLAEEENAKLLKDRLSQKFEVITILPFESNLGRFYRVLVGSYGTEEKAELVARKLRLEGLEPFVMRKD